MRISRLVRPRSLVLLALLAIIAMAGFGFAAANTVPASSAGDGHEEISGYEISNVLYDLNASDPGQIDAVRLDADGDVKPRTMKVLLETGGTNWYTCTSSATAAPWTFVCTTTGTKTTVLAANDLRVVAAQ